MYDLGLNQNRRKKKTQGITFRPFTFQPYNLHGRSQQSSTKFPSLFPNDTDGDRVPDYRDCDSDDPNKQGPIHDKLKGFINQRRERKELEAEDEEGDWPAAKRKSQPRKQPVQPNQNFQRQGVPLYDQLGKSKEKQPIKGQPTGTSLTTPYGTAGRAVEYGGLPAEVQQRELQSREQVGPYKAEAGESEPYYTEYVEWLEREEIPDTPENRMKYAKSVGGDTGPAIDAEYETKEPEEKKSPKERLSELKQKMSNIKGKKKYYTIAKQSNGMWITDEKFDDLQDALKRLDLIEEYEDIVDVDVVNSRLEAEKRNVRQQITKTSEKTEEGLEKTEEIKDKVKERVLPSKSEDKRKKAVDILAKRLRGTTGPPTTRLRSTVPNKYLGTRPEPSFSQQPRTPSFGMADTRVSFRDRTSDEVNPFINEEKHGYNIPENVPKDYQEESPFGSGVVPYRPIGRLQVSTSWQGKPYKPVNPFGIKLTDKSSRPKGMLPMAKFQFMNLGVSPGKRSRGGKRNFMMRLGRSEEY